MAHFDINSQYHNLQDLNTLDDVTLANILTSEDLIIQQEQDTYTQEYVKFIINILNLHNLQQAWKLYLTSLLEQLDNDVINPSYIQYDQDSIVITPVHYDQELIVNQYIKIKILFIYNTHTDTFEYWILVKDNVKTLFNFTITEDMLDTYQELDIKTILHLDLYQELISRLKTI